MDVLICIHKYAPTVGPRLMTTQEIGPPRNCDRVLADGFFNQIPLCLKVLEK